MADWYEDEQVRFPVPPSMRVKRNSKDETFASYEIKTRGHQACAILSIHRSAEANSITARLQAHDLRGDFDSEHVRVSRVRPSLAESLSAWQESAFEDFIKRNGETRHQSYLTSQAGDEFVELSIAGSGDYGQCVATWREFVAQLVVKQGESVAAGRPAECRMRQDFRTVKPRAVGRLPAPPSTPLPSSLDYLRPAIEVLARRTIAELETGDSDPTALLEVLNLRFAEIEGPARRNLLTATAKELQTWAESLPEKNRKWACAGAHAFGVLRYLAEHVPNGTFG